MLGPQQLSKPNRWPISLWPRVLNEVSFKLHLFYECLSHTVNSLFVCHCLNDHADTTVPRLVDSAIYSDNSNSADHVSGSNKVYWTSRRCSDDCWVISIQMAPRHLLGAEFRCNILFHMSRGWPPACQPFPQPNDK